MYSQYYFLFKVPIKPSFSFINSIIKPTKRKIRKPIQKNKRPKLNSDTKINKRNKGVNRINKSKNIYFFNIRIPIQQYVILQIGIVALYLIIY